MGIEKKKLNFLIIILVILVAIFWTWWIPGDKVAIDFPKVPQESLKALMDYPRVWFEKDVEGLGEYTVFTLWTWPNNFMTGALANLGVTFALYERMLLLVIILASTVGIFKLTNDLRVSPLAKALAGFFYLTNTYILLVIDGGQLSIALAYALFPFVFWLIESSITQGLKKKILASLGVFLIGVFDIRYFFLLFFLSLLRFGYGFWELQNYQWLSWTFSWTKLAVVAGVILISLNAYWVIPLFFVPLGQETFAMLTQKTATFTSLGHSLILLSPHWFKNVFGEITPLKWEFMLIPLLVFLAPILRPKDKRVGFWLLVATIPIFLVKGESPPLANIYHWLFNSVPGFSLFRDSTKFFIFTALAYSILLAVTFDEVSKKFANVSRVKTILFVATLIYLLLLVRPVWLGQLNGTFSKPVFEDEYRKLSQLFEQDQNFSRIFWIGTKPPLGYFSPNHPSLEAQRLIQKRPFAAGAVGTYENFNFLRESPYMGQLFDIAAIKYIADPYPDPRRKSLSDDEKKYYRSFLDQLSHLPWVEPVSTNSAVPLLKTKNHQDHFFLPSNLWFVVGSDSLYDELMQIPNFKLSDNGITFVEERPGISDWQNKTTNSVFLLYNKFPIDLAASFLNPDNFIFSAVQLKNDPDSSGWWKRVGSDLIKWRSFLQQKYQIETKDFDYGGGWAVAEGSVKLKVQSAKFRKDNILLARVMESTRSGSIRFFQGNDLIGQVDTKVKNPQTVKIKLTGYKDIPDQIFQYDKSDFKWYEIGPLKSGEPLTIKTEGDINVVNVISVVDQNLWQQIKQKVDKSVASGKVYQWSDLTADQRKNLFKGEKSGQVIYKQINPTHYQVTVSGLKDPSTLVFSEAYHPGWTLNGEPAIPLYGLINGFEIKQDGTYDVKFYPQKYVNIGLIISIATVGLLGWYLFSSAKHSS